jgi:tetratricopeptide (TPR) repeat protein
MKKISAFLFFTCSLVSAVFAQTDKDYKDLLTMFVGEKYEKCLYKAEGYTLADETKKDALPYLFMSRCYFEMSKKEEFREKYPNAFKDALKFASKYGSKDKEKVHMAQYEDYFAELRLAAMAEAESMMDTEKYSKAKQIYDQLLDLDANDAGAQLMLGLAFTGLKSKKEAETAIAAAKKILTEKRAGNTKEQLQLLRDALTRHATALGATSKSAAKEWLDLGLEYFQDDKEYKVTYDSIAD